MSGITRRDMLAMTVPTAFLGSAAFAQMGEAEEAKTEEHAAHAHGHPHANSAAMRVFAQAYADGKYALPPLPYAEDALEPHIDAQTMRLHHGAHHKAYVDGLNKALDTAKTAADLEPPAIEALQRNISFNGGGHMLHTLFWATMGPDAGGSPEGELAAAITRDFGGFEKFQQYFTKVATGVKGSGWAILAYEPIGDRLMCYALGDQDLRLVAGTVPILGVDVWEHAYYLKYQNKRADYVKAWWNVVNWDVVSELHGAHRVGHHA